MVPSTFVALASMPLTPNRKVDRSALTRYEIRSVGEGAAEPPRPGLETVLAGIWSKVLGVDEIGRDDDFFDLGGHSLLAVRLFAEIEKATARIVPLSALFQAPTIRSMTELMGRDRRVVPWTSLVPVQPAGTQPPFFHVSPFLISVLSFTNLARHLGPDQPLYGLQPQGMDGDEPIHDNIEDMAAHYIDEMRQLQPSGPYAVGGHCSGSWVAFEIARQLQAAGQDVSVLVLVDSEPPGIEPPAVARHRYMFDRLVYYRRHRRLFDAVRWRLGLLLQHYLLRRVGTAERRRVAELRTIHTSAHSRYQPRGVVHGDATLIRSQESASLADQDWHVRWDEMITGRLRVAVIPGTHAELVQDANSESVAQVVAALLRERRSDVAGGVGTARQRRS
jgi:thioesterase domain-containing protein